MEALSKILDFIGKYAWAVFVTTCFVLFVPDDAAKQIGLSELREQFKGALWILFVLTFVVSLGALLQYIDRRLLDGWLESRRKEKTRQKQQQEVMEAPALRLSSLDLNEQMWIKYCLFHNTQTLSAERTNRTAQSLNYKGIVEEGPSHVLDLPFHIPDQVWRYLLDHKTSYFPRQSGRTGASQTHLRGSESHYGPITSVWANPAQSTVPARKATQTGDFERYASVQQAEG